MNKYKHIDLLIVGFIFLILYIMPPLFVRIDGEVSWRHVLKIWQDNALLIPLFLINHFVLLPRLMQNRRYVFYSLALFILLILAGWICNIIDPPSPPLYLQGFEKVLPSKIPPYANMLMYAVLITGIDVGLFFSHMWQQNEQKTLELEKRNTAMELELLRNQVSPHFFMNTLNNIYALVDSDSQKAKTAVMKLSKMMRYLLYESNQERVKLSKEFEFICSYIDLMRLRYTDSVVFDLSIPDHYSDLNIPPMLFISYVENAVKYGVSYQQTSVIEIHFTIENGRLRFFCSNHICPPQSSLNNTGIGLKNSQSRLSLIYAEQCDLTISEKDGRYIVELIIPLV